jgi:hypothetical protein
MDCTTGSTALRRYNRRMIYSALAYAVTLLPITYAVRHNHPTQLVAILLTILPAVANASMVGVIGLYLKEETDEFQRELLVKGLLWAAALTGIVTSTWGLLEMLSHVTPLPSFWVYVIYWPFYAVSNVVLRLRYRIGRDE